MSDFKDFRDLIVWRKAMDLALRCYRETQNFPATERYGITLQIRKSAVSVPSNIAEGHGRRSTREFLHFLGFARGSLAELQTQIILSASLGLFSSPETELLSKSEEVARLLHGLERALQDRLDRTP